MDSQIVQQGWLTKQGRIVKNWKRRYFVLSNDKLVYYADAERKQIKGFLNLFQSTIASICHLKDRQHLFCVITQNRELKIQAGSAESQEEWIQIINEVVKRKQTRDLTDQKNTISNGNAITKIDDDYECNDGDDDGDDDSGNSDENTDDKIYDIDNGLNRKKEHLSTDSGCVTSHGDNSNDSNDDNNKNATNTCHNDCNNDISDGNDHNVEQITV